MTSKTQINMSYRNKTNKKQNMEKEKKLSNKKYKKMSNSQVGVAHFERTHRVPITVDFKRPSSLNTIPL